MCRVSDVVYLLVVLDEIGCIKIIICFFLFDDGVKIGNGKFIVSVI